MKHTDGPWEVRNTVKGPYVVRKDASVGDGAICKVLKVPGHGRLFERMREMDANARLMATSPDLLALAQSIVDEYSSTGPFFEIAYNWRTQAEELLKKING